MKFGIDNTRDYRILDIDMMTKLQNATKKKKNPMAGYWTKAGSVRKTFKAGRPLQKDRVVKLTTAAHEACIMLNELREAMAAVPGLSPDDVAAALVLMTPETLGQENAVFFIEAHHDVKKLPKMFFNKQKAAYEMPGKIMSLGIAVRQVDHDADTKNGVVTWVEPFLTGRRAETALIHARNMFGEGKEGKSEF